MYVLVWLNLSTALTQLSVFTYVTFRGVLVVSAYIASFQPIVHVLNYQYSKTPSKSHGRLLFKEGLYRRQKCNGSPSYLLCWFYQ